MALSWPGSGAPGRGTMEPGISAIRLMIGKTAPFVGWASVCGMAGGLVNFIRRLEYSGTPVESGGHWTYTNQRITDDEASDEALKKYAFWLVMLRELLLGAAGGIATAGILAAVGRMDDDPIKVGSALALTGTMFAGGFISRRVLAVAANRLEKELSQTQREVEESRVETKEEIDYQKMVTTALTWISGPHPQEHHRAVAELAALTKQRPKDRAVAILLGRAYRKVQRIPMGIEALTRFMDAIEGDKSRKDDYADALYNRACYESLLSKQDPSMRIAALQDLKKSIDLLPDNKAYAKEDKDFEALAADPEFGQLVLG